MKALMVLFSFPNCRSDLLELLSVHNVGFMAFPDFIFSLPTTIFFSFLVFFTFLFFSITSNIVCLNFSEGGSRDFQCFCKKRPLSRETWQIFRFALAEIEVNYVRGYVDNASERQKSKNDKKRKKTHCWRAYAGQIGSKLFGHFSPSGRTWMNQVVWDKSLN